MTSTPYDRQSSFALFSAENPLVPHTGTTLDAEFNAVKTALDDTQQNLALIQDDDGALARGSVGQAQFDASVSLGFGAPSSWEAGATYDAEVDTVFYTSKFYICVETHVADVTFDSDKWEEIADFTLAAVIDDGTITSAKLAPGAVTADKIGSGSISNDKLASGAVSTAKIADEAVTFAKLAVGIGPSLADIIIPVGVGPLQWTGRTAPTGWVLCGATYLRATYPALWAFAAIEIAAGNTLYGVGDGSTTFTIATMDGYAPVGTDASATRIAAITDVGDTAGAATHTLTLAQLPTGITSANASQAIAVTSTNYLLGNTTTNSGSSPGGGTQLTAADPGSGAVLIRQPSSGTNSISVTSNNTSGSTMPLIQPVKAFRYIIKAH